MMRIFNAKLVISLKTPATGNKNYKHYKLFPVGPI